MTFNCLDKTEKRIVREQHNSLNFIEKRPFHYDRIAKQTIFNLSINRIDSCKCEYVCMYKVHILHMTLIIKFVE